VQGNYRFSHFLLEGETMPEQKRNFGHRVNSWLQEPQGELFRLSILDDAMTMSREAFRERLERFLRQNGFEL
jgi:hypothetical protein